MNIIITICVYLVLLAIMWVVCNKAIKVERKEATEMREKYYTLKHVLEEVAKDEMLKREMVELAQKTLS